MISRKQKTIFNPVVCVLTVALLLSANASAATPSNEVALIHNERAAQLAIMSSPGYRDAASTPRSVEQGAAGEATLAHNEQAARCVIALTVCAPAAHTARMNQTVAAGETTLAQSERAAQRVIVDPAAYPHSQSIEPVAKASSLGE